MLILYKALFGNEQKSVKNVHDLHDCFFDLEEKTQYLTAWGIWTVESFPVHNKPFLRSYRWFDPGQRRGLKTWFGFSRLPWASKSDIHCTLWVVKCDTIEYLWSKVFPWYWNRNIFKVWFYVAFAILPENRIYRRSERPCTSWASVGNLFTNRLLSRNLMRIPFSSVVPTSFGQRSLDNVYHRVKNGKQNVVV